MPTYVYKFVETGETIEVQQGFQDASLTQAVHPATGVTMPVKKVFTPVGVTFKGGGFYKTDSRGGSSKSPAGAAASDGTGDKAAAPAAADGGGAASTPAPAPAASTAASSPSTSD
jgi:predicted nucleic acid-binding Zn ribbon protein